MSRRAKRRRSGNRGGGRAATWKIRTGLAAAVTTVLIVAVSWGFGSSGEEPPDFTMVAYQGQDVLGGDTSTLRELLGNGQPVVVNFWAASCPPCREEMPGFQRVYDDLGEAFTLVGVDIGPFVNLGTHEGARQFLSEYDIRYPAAYAEDANVVRAYEIRGMPTTVFFDGAGEQVNKHTGYLPEAQLRREIEDLLATAE